jgi:UDP-N-acetylglucosamine 2-epimerase (non-hydrolysing)
LKICSIVGARPQFIKEAVVGQAIRSHGIRHVLINTGQHYDPGMSQVFFKDLGIKYPDYDIGIGSGSHAQQTGKAMMAIEEILLTEKPDMVMVYGDTNATLAGALAAAKLKIPVAHVEAGLRQSPKDMPEEINRVTVDHISSLLFCPTSRSMDNLLREGITSGVHFVGDVMYDLFLKETSELDVSQTLRRFGLQRDRYVLTTIHRDFNTDSPDRLGSILTALQKVSSHMPVVFPMHPRTKRAVQSHGVQDLLGGIKVLDPLPYLDMMSLLIGSNRLITDSGGLQKEAYFAGVPSVVLMPDTAWIELVESGWSHLVDADPDQIVLRTLGDHQKPGLAPNLYGQGDASDRIAQVLASI